MLIFKFFFALLSTTSNTLTDESSFVWNVTLL